MSAAEYELIRSARRTLAVEVRRDGSVVVRAPRRMPQAQIDAFFAARRDWIAQAKARQQARREAYPEPTEAERRALTEKAKAVLPRKVAHYAAVMGLTPSGVRITSARTRFGSCSAKNGLCFSWRLMRFPDEAIDYVVVHELAHIVHKNHAAPFYALIGQYLSDWRERERLLKA